MSQQINLYQAQFREIAPIFAAKIILGSGAVAALMLTAIAVYGGWQFLALQRQSSAIERQYQSIAQEKADLEQKITLASADPALVEQVQQMENLLKSRQQLRTLLQDDAFSEDQGYSRYLAALARQYTPGVWLTDIMLTGAGRELALKGLTVNPELLPEYLQNLSRESLLQGMKFEVFQLKRVEDQKGAKTGETLEFLVATSEEAAQQP